MEGCALEVDNSTAVPGKLEVRGPFATIDTPRKLQLAMRLGEAGHCLQEFDDLALGLRSRLVGKGQKVA